MRYSLPLHDLPSFCACGDSFNIKKKGVSWRRHDGVCNLLTSLLEKICKNVEIDAQSLTKVGQLMFSRNINSKKKRKYQQRVVDVEIGIFTPQPRKPGSLPTPGTAGSRLFTFLVFGRNGGM